MKTTAASKCTYFILGCCAKFSARSSLYIHSKKHLQDVDSLKTRCPVSSCNKLFTSKHSMKTHMVKQHNFSAGIVCGVFKYIF